MCFKVVWNTSVRLAISVLRRIWPIVCTLIVFTLFWPALSWFSIYTAQNAVDRRSVIHIDLSGGGVCGGSMVTGMDWSGVTMEGGGCVGLNWCCRRPLSGATVRCSLRSSSAPVQHAVLLLIVGKKSLQRCQPTTNQLKLAVGCMCVRPSVCLFVARRGTRCDVSMMTSLITHLLPVARSFRRCVVD